MWPWARWLVAPATTMWLAPSSYGYGLERKGDLIRHGGSMPGFASTLLGDLDSGYAVAVLMNGADEHDATEVVAEFALDLHRGLKPELPGDPDPPPDDPPGTGFAP